MTLALDAYLTHTGDATENVSVVFRAVDGESGFQRTVERESLGTVSTEGEVVVTENLTVERSGSYRLEVLVYQGNRRVAAGGKRVRGLDSLTPPYARTTVQFHRFDRSEIPTISYTIADADGNHTTLNTSVYLTNRGNANTGDLRLLLIARQAESNIVASRQVIALGEIEHGETVTPSATLTVPSGYNYYLDAVLWKNGVIVGTARSVANLDPKRRIAVNQTVEDVGLQVSDFEEGQVPAVDRPSPEPTPGAPTGTQTPGFGIGTALVALIGSGFLARRYFNE
ncbi:MAG: PGF-CTERM sorting domain-containing protein [Halodesulfurarchaeum sp.]